MTARLARRLWLWIGLGALVLLLGTCTFAVIIPGVQLAIRESQAPPPQALAGLPTHSSAPSAAPSSRTNKATATPILTTTATPTAATVSMVLLTGFSATEAEWRASHVAATDPSLQSGCCWDPDPTLPRDLSTAVSGYRYTEGSAHVGPGAAVRPQLPSLDEPGPGFGRGFSARLSGGCHAGLVEKAGRLRHTPGPECNGGLGSGQQRRSAYPVRDERHWQL